MNAGTLRVSALLFGLMTAVVVLGADIYDDIATQIRAGNAKGLATYFSSNVEIEAPGVSGVYSKQQAEMILKDIFAKNPPKSFTVAHKGASGEGGKYMIGKYMGTTANVRVYVYVKDVSGQTLIHEIRFEAE